MFNPTTVMADQLGDFLAETYLEHFPKRRPEYAGLLAAGTRLVLERLSNSDALYHNAEHSIMVTLVGQQILRGRMLCEALQPEDWLHYIVALLIHDIGYARGACRGDSRGAVVINAAGERITPPRGASDACLAPYHVERGMIFARERFGDSDYIDAERIARAVAYTRFPVPLGPDFAATEGEPALVRAADLIGAVGRPVLPAQDQRALPRIRGDRHRAAARLPLTGGSGGAVSGVLLDRGRALYRRRLPLSRAHDRGQAVDLAAPQPRLSGRITARARSAPSPARSERRPRPIPPPSAARSGPGQGSRRARPAEPARP